ncbi:nitroreductase family protein [Chloroflexota bacterium]
METFETIKTRASLKTRISPRNVEPEKVNKILDAARFAPSARNLQPWRFIVINDKKRIETLIKGAFNEGNSVLSAAPVFIVACAKPSDDLVLEGREYYLHDVGMAMENMLLAATELGLVTHPVTGLNEKGEAELKRILSIPDEVRFVVATPVAYPDEGSYEDSAQKRLSDRTRKDLKEIVYLNAWGKPL